MVAPLSTRGTAGADLWCSTWLISHWCEATSVRTYALTPLNAEAGPGMPRHMSGEKRFCEVERYNRGSRFRGVPGRVASGLSVRHVPTLSHSAATFVGKNGGL